MEREREKKEEIDERVRESLSCSFVRSFVSPSSSFLYINK